MAKQARSQDECIIKIVEMMSLTLNSRRSLIKDKKRKDITKHMQNPLGWIVLVMPVLVICGTPRGTPPLRRYVLKKMEF
jgi:hypothetical protein